MQKSSIVYWVMVLSIFCCVCMEEGYFHVSVWPPYSSSYQCRCLPPFDIPLYQHISSKRDIFLFHSKFCESRQYNNRLKQHVLFLEQLFEGDTHGVCTKLLAHGRSNEFKIAQKIRKKLSQHDVLLSSHDKSILEKSINYFSRDKKDTHACDLISPDQNLVDQFEHNSKQVYSLLASRVPSVSTNRLFDLMNSTLWLYKLALNLVGKSDLIRADFLKAIEDFPFVRVITGCHSTVVKEMLLDIQQTHAWDKLFALWHTHMTSEGEYEGDFSPDMVTHVIEDKFLVLKDMSVVFALLMSCVAGAVQILQDNHVGSPIDIYNKVSELSIGQTVDAIVTIGDGIVSVVQSQHGLLQQGFWRWLQKKWSVIPVMVGVIIINVLSSI